MVQMATVLQINQQFMMKIKQKMMLEQFQNKKLLCTLREFFNKQEHNVKVL